MTHLYDITATKVDGSAWPLRDLYGRVVLVVALPTADSTPQSDGVVRLAATFAAQGLVVLGLPVDDAAAAARADLPVLAAAQPQLTAWLAQAAPGPFGTTAMPGYTKYLVGRDGTLRSRFEAAAEPKELIAAVQAALAEAEPSQPPPPPAAPLPVPVPPPAADADVIEAELVPDDDSGEGPAAAGGLAAQQAQVDADLLAAELAGDPQRSVGADLQDLADDLAVLEAESRAVTEHERGDLA